MNNKITKIIAEEINDSRGNPTIKVTVWVDDKSGSFSVPSGASTGIHEAHELRDDDERGVKKAILNIENILVPALIGQNILDQKEIDKILINLDGTSNKEKLGGNAIIGISIACAKTAAKILNLETFEYLRIIEIDFGEARDKIKFSQKIPYLYMNLINGGKHAQNNT
jgi:enolase